MFSCYHEWHGIYMCDVIWWHLQIMYFNSTPVNGLSESCQIPQLVNCFSILKLKCIFLSLYICLWKFSAKYGRYRKKIVWPYLLIKLLFGYLLAYYLFGKIFATYSVFQKNNYSRHNISYTSKWRRWIFFSGYVRNFYFYPQFGVYIKSICRHKNCK